MSKATLAAPQANVPEFLSSANARFRRILERLQWTESGLLKQHSSTKVPAQLKADAELPVSCVHSAEQSLQYDAATLIRLLGTAAKTVTFDDLQANYTAAQKLRLYEYALQHTKQAYTDSTAEDNSVFAELVAETKREQKKQRRHRISKPTLNEELHQLVELQMQALIRHRKDHSESKPRVQHSQNRARSRSPRREHKGSSSRYQHEHARSKPIEQHYRQTRDRSKHRRRSRSPVAKDSRSHRK